MLPSMISMERDDSRSGFPTLRLPGDEQLTREGKLATNYPIERTKMSGSIETILAEKIRDALVRDAVSEAERVHVAVENGRVILRGIVRCESELLAIENAARQTPGVNGVESHLRSEEGLSAI
jgi:osmotically-inducible protein OsmY